MNKLTWNELQTEESLRRCGRIYQDEKRNVLWFNWTCSGFICRFSGSVLRAVVLSVPEEMTAPFEHEPVMEQPVIGVHIDEGDLKRYKLSEGMHTLTLYEGEDNASEHTAEIRKLSENVMGKCALVSIETEGAFLPAPQKETLQIEFVGDSITCGYGNENDSPDFDTADENGEATYGFLAARALNAGYSAICVTGCGVTDPVTSPGLQNRGMYTMYEYTDAPLERMGGDEAQRKWDFASHKSDIIVVNLGTNDMVEQSWQNYSKEASEAFVRNYRALITRIRQLNGAEPLIVCSLGTMSYYLYDEIRDIVEEYSKTEQDHNICCFKYGEQNIMMEGMGSGTHPSLKTHARMARELVGFLQSQRGK